MGIPYWSGLVHAILCTTLPNPTEMIGERVMRFLGGVWGSGAGRSQGAAALNTTWWV